MWWLWLLVGLALNVVAYLLMPKAKTSQPQAVKDLDQVTAEAGRCIPVLGGDMTIKGGNFLASLEDSKNTSKVNA